MCEVNAFGFRLQVVTPPSLHPAFSRPLLPTCRHRRVGLFYPARCTRSDFSIRPRFRYLFNRQFGIDAAAPRLGQGDGRWTARGAAGISCCGCPMFDVSCVFHGSGETVGPETEKARQPSDCHAFSSVGVTGFEPATTRPPDVYSKVEYSACAQHISFLPYKAVDFSVDSTVKG